MKKYQEQTVEVIAGIKCDCCGREAVYGIDEEASEFSSLRNVGGYASIFGDGTQIFFDICQYCLKEKLGPWLNLVKAERLEGT